MVAAAVLCLALLAGACRSGGEPDLASEGPSTLPLEGFLFREGEDRVAVESAIQELTSDCMASRGFTYMAPPISEGITEPRSTRYGIADLSTAKRFGYGGDPADQEPELPSEDELLPADPVEREQYLLALNGPSDKAHTVDIEDPITGEVAVSYYRGGCSGEAELEIFGDWARYEALRFKLDDLQVTSHQEARSSDAVEATVDEWRECMEQQGFPVDRPEDFLDRDWPDEVTDEEIDTAVADVKCKESSNLVDVWMRAEALRQQELLEEGPGLVEEYETLWQDAVQRARETLGGQ